jgi:pheromone shutdown protein TraB
MMPRQKVKDWRQYYRLVHNFSKAYPYALVAKKLVNEADRYIAENNLKGAKREKYISSVQNELFQVFEGQMRKLTVSQGALIMKLVDREVGKSSYNIIKGYKNRMAAGFWQGIAKMFGSDLKKPYDPEGEDKEVEELVKLWEADEFYMLYWSLFWKEPPKVDIPAKYL